MHALLGPLETALRAIGRGPPVIPFAIVGVPRTGSTLLLKCIQQHPKIFAHGELFHWVRSERAGKHAILRHGRKIYFDENEDGVDFLLREVYGCPPRGVGAVGAKIFSEYVKCPGTANLFINIRDRIPRLKVIHIVRANYLDVLVSRALAGITGRWEEPVDAPPSEEKPIRLAIVPDDARTAFARMKQADRFFATIFEPQNYYRVEYAELCADLPRQINRVANFLSQAPFAPSVLTRKQIDRPVHSIIENYAELRAAFAGTEYEVFFVPFEAAPSPVPAGHQQTRVVALPMDAVPGAWPAS